jgi:hypothetical protein
MNVEYQERNVKEAERKLNWAIKYVSKKFKCSVLDFDGDNFKVKFQINEQTIIMLIPKTLIDDCNPDGSYLPGGLRSLISRRIEREIRKKRVTK